jgi:feruloyl esterase
MGCTPRGLAFAATTLLCFACNPLVANADTDADCSALRELAVPNTTITSALLIRAANGLPEFCQVQGHVDAEINFVLRLPTQWNGKFIFECLGGLDGLIPGPGIGLARGYAEIGTDTGHTSADGTLYDGTWAYHNPERQVNWAYRSTHVVAVAGKAITAGYYGQAPRYSYYDGCSGGGRHAQMSASRYPEDFNGVVAGSPFLSPTGQVIAWNWDEQALADNPIPPAKLPLITKAVVAECDAKDGVIDGLISDPRRCDFKPESLACTPGADPSSCLTQGEITALKKLYAGPSTSSEVQLFPGWQPGVEYPLWLRALVNSVNGGPGELLVLIPDQFLKYFIFGPGYNPYSFNFDRDPAALAEAAELFDVKPDLAAYAAAGGKVLTYHGWADPRLATTYSIAFRAAVKHNLRRAHEAKQAKIEDFYRLFLVPGMGHCAGGPGPGSVDWLTPLEKWVEQGIAPDVIIGSHVTHGVVDLTRPLCPYPQEAVYKQGDIHVASSFSCQVRNPSDGNDVPGTDD